MKRMDLPDGSAFFEGPKGAVYVHSGAAGVVAAKYWGEHDVQSFLAITSEIDRRAGPIQKLQFFTDLSELTNYDGEFRNLWIKWFSGNRSRMARAVFLQKSVLVKIGLSMVNIALAGMIESHTDAAEYERAASLAGLKKIVHPKQAA